jgi:hypothetical protein
MIKEEDRDLFIRLLSDIHRAVCTVQWLIPTHLASFHRHSQHFATVAEFDPDLVARKDHTDAMKRVAMPGQRLTGRQPLPALECRAAAKENFVGHFDLRRRPSFVQTPLLIYILTIAGRSECRTKLCRGGKGYQRKGVSNKDAIDFNPLG